MKYKTIIFDLDGTLIHSAPDLQAAINHALNAISRDCLDLPTVISFIGNGVEKLVERGLRATGHWDQAFQDSALATFLSYYDAHSTTLTRPYPGVVETLHALQAEGVALGVCTNKPTMPARAICEELGLGKFFASIAGAEPGLPKKPDAAPLLACMAELGGTKETTLYVGDSAVDYRTALNAEVEFCLFTQGYLNEVLPDLPSGHRFDRWGRDGILPR